MDSAAKPLILWGIQRVRVIGSEEGFGRILAYSCILEKLCLCSHLTVFLPRQEWYPPFLSRVECDSLYLRISQATRRNLRLMLQAAPVG
jgi:hypothetical protein